jgi:AraC-like DNA-binding protein
VNNVTTDGGKIIEEKVIAMARGLRRGMNECASAAATAAESDSLLDREVMLATRTVMAPWQARCLRAYVAAHLHARIRVADLVRVLHFSPNRFGEVFRKSFDCTPHQYIMRERVRRAQNLLLVSGDSLREIATKCGFGHQAHLSNVFRKMMGQSPGRWRRVHAEPMPKINESAERAVLSLARNVDKRLGSYWKEDAV